MSTSAGLQRRRGGGGGGEALDQDQPSRTNSPFQHSSQPSSSNQSSIRERQQSNTSASKGQDRNQSQGSHKVVYDPRDMDDERELNSNPKLTLMEECLLLGLKDKQGYLSFWNDNISYTLRGCILLELALRGRIAVKKDVSRKRVSVQDRILEVIDSKMTGEVLLDEALKMMKSSEGMSASQWVDLMSGETWNVMKIGYQLKQVRERLAKGLVDKGILRTEKRNFLLFDMATHPITDTSSKDAVLRRVLTLLTSSSQSIQPNQFYKEEPNSSKIAFKVTRSLCLLCCSFSANVLENALTHLSYDGRENAFQKADDVLNEFSQWPMAPSFGGNVANGTGIGEGSLDDPNSLKARLAQDSNLGVGLNELARAVRNELNEQGNETMFECIAAVLHVLSRMDSLL